jgi:carboxymethylenebutenolidase
MPEVDLTARSAERGGSQPLRAYVAEPDGSGPWPGMVVVHEIFGVDDQTRKHADRLARMGYLAVAVDLFSAGGARKCLVSTMRDMTRGQGRAFTDIDVARQWLLESDRCTGKVGVIGFCMGGGFALIAAGDFQVSAVNYGFQPKDLDAALADACPIVASYGKRDRSLRGAAGKLETALTAAGIEHDVKEYPTAGHAFLNEEGVGPKPLRPLVRLMGIKPDPVASADAWQRIEAFLRAHLGQVGADDRAR